MFNRGDIKAPRVLIVEPQWTIARFLKFLLINWKYEVESCRTGKKGLRSVERAQPDLIILEPALSDMEGWTFCERLRPLDSTRRLHLLILTWMDDPEAKRKAHRVGADAFLTKPFEVNELMQQVGALVPNPARRSNWGSVYVYNKPPNGPKWLRSYSPPPATPYRRLETHPCPSCGSEVRVEDTHCLNCGQRLYPREPGKKP